jgi:uncharacterized protein
MPMATEAARRGLRRRDWLAGAAACAATIALPARFAFAASASASSSANGVFSTSRLLTAWDAADQYWAGVWSPGQSPKGIALPARAHEILALPARLTAAAAPHQALAVARRPGEYLVRFDSQRANVLAWHDMEDDRFLGGHAVFSAFGDALFTTETDGATGAGLVAERDPLTLKKRREFASGGIGPHALMLEPGGTLLVANGGVLNLPETGRRKLNLDRMDPSLARIDPASGRILAQWRLDDPFLSLRHLARAPDGTIAIALQAEHADAKARQAAPLLALLTAEGLRTIALAPGLQLGGYAGDVAWLPPALAATGSAGQFLVSATPAGQLASWSAKGDALGRRTLAEAGALAVNANRWLAGGAHGLLMGADRERPLKFEVAVTRWDNHAQLLVFG